jgi:hypothetical protein
MRKMIVVIAMAMLAISAQAGTASANLVQNGGFETGNFNNWTLTNGANDGYTFVVSNAGNPSMPTNAGNYEAMLSTNGNAGTISQAFATTAGQSFTVSFWLASDDINGSNTNVFQAVWNGQVENLNPILNPNLASPYTQYQFTTTATGANTTLGFNFMNDPSYFHLDNVDVEATPTPIPAAFWLLGSGLMGLAGMRRKKA